MEGIEETRNETQKEYEEKVQALVQEKSEMERVQKDRAHRAGKKGQNRKRVNLFVRCKDRQNILRKGSSLQGTNKRNRL